MMKFTVLCLALLTTMPVAAEVYQCPKANGGNEYTADYREGCTSANLERINSYESSNTGTTSGSPSVSYHNTGNSQPKARSNPKQQALAKAQQRLEEGKKQRLGNERNYAKYQERIRRLEEDVAKAEKNLR